MKPHLFRASSIGKLMGEPRSKSDGPLTQTARTYIQELAAQAVLGIEFEVTGRELEKGILCEPEAIALLNRVLGRQLSKNTERRVNEWITGEADLVDTGEGFDLKVAWSAKTFPILARECADKAGLYEWQARAYCALWDLPRWHIAYALLDTPEHLVGFEPLQQHVVSHLPEHHRLTLWTIERDAKLEQAMFDKVKHARAYFAEVVEEFDRTHAVELEPA